MKNDYKGDEFVKIDYFMGKKVSGQNACNPLLTRMAGRFQLHHHPP